MTNQLKNEAMNALGWSSALQSSSQFISFILGIILARLLTPEDFGLVAMVLVLTAFSQLLTDFGLSASLIQKKDATPLDFSSCFWFSSVIGVAIMFLMMYASESIANLYGREELTNICLCLSVIFLSNSISSTPKAVLTKNLKHKTISLIDLYTNLLGWIVALAMAINDFSYWSLVAQQLVTHMSRAILLIIKSQDWLLFSFSVNSIKNLFSFSIYVFSTQTLIQARLQTDKVLVGKFIDSATLGLYTRAYQIMVFPINNISRSISNVMFPTFSKIQNDPDRIGKIYLKIIGCISFITFPMMLGLMSVAPYFIEVILGNHWLGMTIYLRFFCAIGVIMSILTITGSIYLATGNSKLQFKINLICQPLQISGLIIGIQYGMKGMLAGYLTTYLISVYLGWRKAIKLINLNFVDVFTALAPAFFISTTMTVINFSVDYYILEGYSPTIKLLILVASGALFYLVANLIIKPKPYRQVKELIQERLNKKT